MNRNYNVLQREIRKAEEKDVAAFALKVRQAQKGAAERLARAQKELKRAKRVVKAQEKALKKFKNSGDASDLEVFGV